MQIISLVYHNKVLLENIRLFFLYKIISFKIFILALVLSPQATDHEMCRNEKEFWQNPWEHVHEKLQPLSNTDPSFDR